MPLNRSSAIAALAVTAAAGLLLATVVARSGPEPARADGPSAVDPSVPDHELLTEVLEIVANRKAGGRNFSYVPQARPEGLHRMFTGNPIAPFVDGYEFGDQRVQAYVEFAEKPTHTCAGIRNDGDAGICVRHTTITPADLDTPFRNVTVYLTGRVNSRPAPDDRQAQAAQRYWAGVDIVPLTEATWFTDLVTRAESAPKATR